MNASMKTIRLLSLAIWALSAMLLVAIARGEEASGKQCLSIEFFTRNDCTTCAKGAAFLEDLQARYPHTQVTTWNIDESERGLERLKVIQEAFKVDRRKLPSFYLCRQFIQGFKVTERTDKQIEDLLTVHVYWRNGCPHCTAGKKYLATLLAKYPMFHAQLHEITTDAAARREFEALSNQHGVRAPVVPTFHLCGQLVTGFLSEQTTGQQLEQLLKSCLVTCRPKVQAEPSSAVGARWSNPALLPNQFASPLSLVAYLTPPADEATAEDVYPVNEIPEEATAEEADEFDLPPPMPVEQQPVEDAGIEVPYFGRLSVRDLGMPAFTLAIGLIDGFNPCAMWVLLFLLSILVNLHDRRKLVAIAGTFVVISGLVYLAFMAAWLNVFLLIGYMRPAQIVLGVLALIVGAINIKDFFAFKWGVSLTIPESAKPGIAARVRDIVNAEYLWVAITGAIALAVVVNAVELLCSAGFPAMYTQILALKGYSLLTHYAYLLLYIAAYMADDTLMLTIVVITLSKTRLQESGGRWLKLISGAVIFGLGLMMIAAPNWLI